MSTDKREGHKFFNCQIPEDLMLRVKIEGIRRGLSFSGILQEALPAWLDKTKKKKAVPRAPRATKKKKAEPKTPRATKRDAGRRPGRSARKSAIPDARASATKSGPRPSRSTRKSAIPTPAAA